MAGPLVDIAEGITIAFATSSFDAQILDIDGPAFTRAIVDTTHQGTTGGHTKEGSAVPEWGPLNITGHFNADDDPGALFLYAGEQITITWPSTGTWVFQGIIENYEPTSAFKDKMMFNMTIAVDGDIAVTAA